MMSGISLGDGRCIRQTDRAILVQLESGEELWIPQRCVHEDSEVYAADHEGDVVVESWWAEKENLA